MYFYISSIYSAFGFNFFLETRILPSDRNKLNSFRFYPFHSHHSFSCIPSLLPTPTLLVTSCFPSCVSSGCAHIHTPICLDRPSRWTYFCFHTVLCVKDSVALKSLLYPELGAEVSSELRLSRPILGVLTAPLSLSELDGGSSMDWTWP